MKFYLEIDSFSSLDYLRIFRKKIQEENLSDLINGLILKANFLFKNENKISQIKEIVSNFDLSIMINPDTYYYYRFEVPDGFIEKNHPKMELFQNFYDLNRYVYSTNEKEIKYNINKILDYQKNFFSREEVSFQSSILDFFKKEDISREININHYLITPYLFLNSNNDIENIDMYIKVCSEYPNSANRLRLLLYFNEKNYTKVQNIIQSHHNNFESIILWNITYNEKFNTREQLIGFKNFLERISKFRDKLILYYAGLNGIAFLKKYFSDFIIRKQLYPGYSVKPPPIKEVITGEAEFLKRTITNNFYFPKKHIVTSKNDYLSAEAIEDIRNNYECDCFICQNKILRNRTKIKENFFDLLENTRNKFYHNHYCFLKDLNILLNGSEEEKTILINELYKSQIWREIFD